MDNWNRLEALGVGFLQNHDGGFCKNFPHSNYTFELSVYNNYIVSRMRSKDDEITELAVANCEKGLSHAFNEVVKELEFIYGSDKVKRRWVYDQQAILQFIDIDDNSLEDIETSIIFAERMDFTGDNLKRLLNHLEKYIQMMRHEAPSSDHVVICSAIRKYAMNMPQSNVVKYLNWLDEDSTNSVDPVIELELIKALNYRLLYAEFDPKDDHLDYEYMCEKLFDRAIDYCNKRFLLNDVFGNIVHYTIIILNAFESFGSLDKKYHSIILNKIERIKDLEWLYDSLVYDLEHSINEFAEVYPEYFS